MLVIVLTDISALHVILTWGSKHMKLAIICPDIHVPFHDVKATNLLIKVCKTLQPEHFICLGDALDFYQLSRFDKDPMRKTSAFDDVDDFKKLFAKLNAALGDRCQKVFMEGNHEMRFQKWIWQNGGDLGKLIPSLREAAMLEALGWEYYSYGKIYRLGDILYMHGDRCGMNVSMNMLRKYGASVVHGHDHGAGIRWFANAKDRMFSMNCGHLSDMNQQEYLYGGVADWTQGFGIVEYSNDYTEAWPTFVPISPLKRAILWGETFKC